ncbi:hypothetical protein [Candidatus Nitrosarchaeum limnium]|uniref:Uncharacterized protein n=1 Tax=Candidatus Nitrosarchaeum limnium BG20 TaxID=859192 RepID=S2DZ63_9ARCH|nr:hypothetical protein [Candidatus Nitrosarchaeum limnium]EPA04445.1 hypothetical protein BG20_I2457 [Candidatus Nitrosarchaeum limnium BG20]
MFRINQQLVEEFSFKETKAISNNDILQVYVEVLTEHTVED